MCAIDRRTDAGAAGRRPRRTPMPTAASTSMRPRLPRPRTGSTWAAPKNTPWPATGQPDRAPREARPRSTTPRNISSSTTGATSTADDEERDRARPDRPRTRRCPRCWTVIGSRVASTTMAATMPPAHADSHTTGAPGQVLPSQPQPEVGGQAPGPPPPAGPQAVRHHRAVAEDGGQRGVDDDRPVEPAERPRGSTGPRRAPRP